MAADMDTTDGVTSFVSARLDAWHRLGTVTENSFTAEDAMEKGHLGGWNIRKAPIYTMAETGSLPVPGRAAVLRDNPVRKGQIDVLGDVGEGYGVIQNEEHAGLLNALVDESGAHFETAGAIEGGRKVFITMKVPETITIGGVDQIDQYIAAINSHDGSMAFTLMTTPVRIVCKNTLNLALGSTSNIIRVRHSSGAQRHLQTQARESLGIAFRYFAEFEIEAEKMIQTTMTESRFADIISKEFGVDADSATKASATRADAKIDELIGLFNADTQANIHDTAWAGFNALTEWADHFQPTRGSDDPEAARATRTILDNSFKKRALQLMTA